MCIQPYSIGSIHYVGRKSTLSIQTTTSVGIDHHHIRQINIDSSSRAHYSIQARSHNLHSIATTTMPNHFFPELQLPTTTNMMYQSQSDDTKPLSPRTNAVDSSSPRQQNKSTLMAIGGFVIGASSMAALLALHNAAQGQDQSTSLRGEDVYIPQDTFEVDATASASLLQEQLSTNVEEPMAIVRPSGSNDHMPLSQIIQVNDTLTPTQAPSISVSSPIPTLVPTEIRPTSYPTYLPSSGNFPTELPTTQDELNSTGMVISNSILRYVFSVSIDLFLYL